MFDFFTALAEYKFLQYAVVTGTLASIACGIVGTYVVTRGISYIGGAVAHSVLGGLGVAYYLMVVNQWSAMRPLYGAIAAALVAAVIIGLVSLKARGREDTIIGAIWAIGMAVGILFMARTPGYNQNLMSYLFGNILMVRADDLWLIGILDIVVMALGLGFYRQLTAVCFDEEFARLRGVKVELFYLLLLGMTALTVVILITVVGIILVIALLTLPAAIANIFSKKMWPIMLIATVISVVFTFLGMALSYGPDFPPGATIILLLGIFYLLTSFAGLVIKKL